MSTTRPYRIMLADNNMQFRGALRRILAENSNLSVIGEAGDEIEFRDLLKRGLSPQLVILDLSVMIKLGQEKAIPDIKACSPGMKMLVLSMHREEGYIRQVLSSGAEGYLLKQNADAELLPAIEKIRRGGIYFSVFHAPCPERAWKS